MTVFLVALTFQVAFTAIGPVLLARWLARRAKLRSRMVAIGAATWIGSQVVHLPLNAVLVPLLPGPDHALHLAALATLLGLTSGLCEELARFVSMRLAKPEERTGGHGLLFGAGHGGVEAILLVALPGLFGLVNLIVLQRMGLDALGLDPAAREAVERELEATAEYGGLGPLIGALERALSITFHIGASLLVMRAVVERRLRFLFAAIALHAISNAIVVAAARRFGVLAAEAFLLPFTALMGGVIVWTLRALPKEALVVEEPRPEAKGAPIELIRAAKTYGLPPKEVHALVGLDLTIPAGECCALLGPNGAGKTTTIRLINGTLTPTRGHAFVFGQMASDADYLASKRRLGIVPQQPGMYVEFTVKQYLDLVCELYACPYDAELVRSLLEDDVLDRPMAALSGGMQRRLCLAAALLPKPELLVLDEPSAGLDPVAGKQMIAAVRKASVGRTVLLCTHNLAEAEELCTSVVILREGRAALHAKIEELRTARLPRVHLAATNLGALRDALTERDLAPEDATSDEGVGLVVSLPDAEAALPDLLTSLLAAGVKVVGCRIQKPKLEDIFFSVVENSATASSTTASGAEESEAP